MASDERKAKVKRAKSRSLPIRLRTRAPRRALVTAIRDNPCAPLAAGKSATGFPSAALRAGGMTPKAESEEVASGEQRNPETPGFPGRDVPHLRRSAFLSTRHPALTRWANVCRAYGAG